MLNYNQIRERAYIVLSGEPYEVIGAQITRKQKQKPVNQTKLKNLITGSVKQHTFHASDKADEADIEKRKIVYSFKKPDRQSGGFEYWFTEVDDSSQRFSLPEDLIADKVKFMKDGQTVDALIFDENVIGISLPLKVELKVTEAAPAVKGNTTSGATMQVTVETGALITTPQFIKEGDTISIKTETGEYTERVK